MAYMTARPYTDDVLPHTPGSWQAFAGCVAGDPCALFECRQQSPSSVAPASSTCIRCIRGVFGTGTICELSQTAYNGQHVTDQLWPSSACRHGLRHAVWLQSYSMMLLCVTVFRCGGTFPLTAAALHTPPVSSVLHQITHSSYHMPTVHPCLGHGA